MATAAVAAAVVQGVDAARGRVAEEVRFEHFARHWVCGGADKPRGVAVVLYQCGAEPVFSRRHILAN